MTFHGAIEKAERMEMPPQKGSDTPGVLHQLTISDKTKPSRFRMSSQITAYLSEDRYKALLGDREELVDEPVTVVLNEMSASQQGRLKTKCLVFPGHLDNKALADLIDKETAGTTPAAPVAPKPAAPGQTDKGDKKAA